MLFYGDDVPTRYNGFLEDWLQYRVHSDVNNRFEELLFQDLGIRGKLRAKPRPPPRSVATDNASDSDSEATTDDEEAVVEVDTWESDAENDERDVESLQDILDATGTDDLDAQYARAVWSDVPRLHTDPRA